MQPAAATEATGQRRRIDWRKQRQRRPSLAPPPRLHPQLGVRCQRAGNRARRLRRRCPALQARDLGRPSLYRRFVAVVATTNAKDHGSQNTAPATVHYQQQWH